ncbi:metallopeptidase [Roseimicrobium sp. ORNL1]|uniref:metallopeptidase n=1 Tax=Roseimicrobium sp. ORNL1 TaxID=2711231 RepID=UPI0013E1212A|nr:metallopeptidase [Roseimicrobium sp. ORNL1]QIF03984.1 metallopeptidase [Roseimicrobium sp. ORNL1]
MPALIASLATLWLFLLSGFLYSENGKPAETATPIAEKPASRTARSIEGWTVRVDDRLLAPAHAELGTRALELLRAKLTDISTVMAPEPLAKCRKVVIVLDLSHGKLTSMQYHPSVDWLKENGYAEDLAKCVHIPVAEKFADARHNFIQPWCVLHELSHAYHDQVLGFENPRVKQVWDKYVAAERGARVLKIDGAKVRHYAMTNHKEFFAEMSEAYFGTNDFSPFVHGELKESEPETFTLLREIWGPVAGH